MGQPSGYSTDPYAITWSEGERCFAAIVALWSLGIYSSLADEYSDAMDSYEFCNERMKEIADCFTDLYNELTCRHQMKVARLISDTEEPRLSCFTAMAYWQARARNELRSTMRLSDEFRKRYCIPSLPECDNELEIVAALSGAEAANHDFHYNKRRADRIRKLRFGAFNAVVRNISLNSGPIQDYMQAAATQKAGLISSISGLQQGALTSFGASYGAATGGSNSNSTSSTYINTTNVQAYDGVSYT